MRVPVEIVNAFVDGETGGNPAGVVLDADNLNTDQKLKVAQKVGLSETAFVSRSEVATIKLEFFTPERQIAQGYRERVTQFFSLLMRARIELKMPVFVARVADGIDGATMGYSTVAAEWPAGLTEEWVRFEKAIPGLTDRMAIYDEVATKFKPPAPHYYLGVIGTDPALQGSGIGTQLLKSFCEVSASDPLSGGVYLETAQASNLRFYERAGFAETGRGNLGDATLWCMYLPHERR